MTQDPIVEEVHRTREEIAERFNGDLAAICEDARKRQEASGHPTVAHPPRPADPELSQEKKGRLSSAAINPKR